MARRPFFTGFPGFRANRAPLPGGNGSAAPPIPRRLLTQKKGFICNTINPFYTLVALSSIK
ncbi:MAG TPA: hypothetical protein DCZ76_05310 [Treponema sp.]|nr:hypothetical protein [Treponema sp.]